MKKTILIYGVALAVLTGILKFFEYKYLVRDLTTEMYIGIIAFFFTGLGIWVGLKWTKEKQEAKKETPLKDKQMVNTLLDQYNISKREHEVLILIAKGLSNKEIAETLFLSTNTVKTHSSKLFSKLDVNRRTQAVQKAIELGILTDQNLTA